MFPCYIIFPYFIKYIIFFNQLLICIYNFLIFVNPCIRTASCLILVSMSMQPRIQLDMLMPMASMTAVEKSMLVAEQWLQ